MSHILVTSFCEENISEIGCLNYILYNLKSNVCIVTPWVVTNSLSIWLNIPVDAEGHAGGQN